jgi:rRNA maturation endonuclease Nob1
MPIDPLHLSVIPLALSLAALFLGAWLYDIRASRRRKKKEETVYRCMDCRRIYIGTHHTPLARCPKCGKQNAAVRQR